jgi:hypothetical protein
MAVMLSSSNRSKLFAAGVALLIGGGWLAALSFYASLLPWKFGVWEGDEPMVVALHGAAMLCAAGLAVCMATRPLLASRALTHPAVLAAGFVALWGAVASLFVPQPFLSLLGSPQLGEGVLYFADCAVFIAAGLLIRVLPGMLRVFAWPCIAVCVVTPLIVVTSEHLDTTQSWWLFVFDDYLAWYAIAGAVLVLADPAVSFYRRLVVAVLVAAPGLAASGNLSAIAVLAGIAFPLVLLLHVLNRTRWQHGIRIACTASIPLLVGASLLAVWLIGEAGWVQSVTARLLLYRALLPVVAENSGILVVGQGWGQINNAVLLHLLESGATIWDGSWDLSSRDIPHSHNFAVEAFAGGGIPALLGALAIFALVPMVAGRKALPPAAFASVAMAGLGAVWFQLSATSGLSMIALGIAAGPWYGRLRLIRLPRAISTGVLCAMAILQFAAIVWLFDYGIAAQRAVANGYRGVDQTSCGSFPNDSMRGSVGLTQQFDTEFRAIVDDRAAGRVVSPERWEALVRLRCVVVTRIADDESPRLMLADLLFRGQIALDPALQRDAYRFAGVFEDWESELKRFLAVVPGRTDIAVSYLAWRLSRNEPDRVVAFAKILVALQPDDPVGHWFLGAGLAASGEAVVSVESARILWHLRRALELGLVKRTRVEPELIRFIEAGGRRDSGL